MLGVSLVFGLQGLTPHAVTPLVSFRICLTATMGVTTTTKQTKPTKICSMNNHTLSQIDRAPCVIDTPTPGIELGRPRTLDTATFKNPLNQILMGIPALLKLTLSTSLIF